MQLVTLLVSLLSPSGALLVPFRLERLRYAFLRIGMARFFDAEVRIFTYEWRHDYEILHEGVPYQLPLWCKITEQ